MELASVTENFSALRQSRICLHCIMFGQGVQQRERLFTFSTGFSTAFVKKKRFFPHCFPLFPLSFPQRRLEKFIPAVFALFPTGEFFGKKGERHPFFEKEAGFCALFSTPLVCGKVFFSPFWNKVGGSFPRSTPARPGVENREKTVFHSLRQRPALVD